MQRAETRKMFGDASRWRATAATLAVLAAVVLVVPLVRHRVGRQPRPNVLLVVVDTLRRDAVGAYGYDRPTTPFLDRLARTGVLFENGWSHAPQTFNSTASLLTSRLFPLLRLRHVRPRSGDEQGVPIALGISDANVALAEVLSERGYSTIAVFTNPHHHEASRFAQGFTRWRYLPPASSDESYARAAEVNAAFRELAQDLEPDRPWFAYVHYMDVHHPYRPPPELAHQFVTVQGDDKYVNGRPPADALPSERDVRFMRDSYDASIRYTDDHIRDLAAAVGQLARGRDTVLVVTSDHGEEFMEHDGLGHGHSAYPELLRVPLILHGASLPAGTRVRRLARGIDVAPTIVALSGGDAPSDFEGRSLLPFVAEAAAGEERLPRRLRKDDEGVSFAWHGSLRGITFGRLHLAMDVDTRERWLFDAHSEGRLAAEPDEALRARRLERHLVILERQLNRSHQLAVTDESGPLPPGTAAQLRALGYVD